MTGLGRLMIWGDTNMAGRSITNFYCGVNEIAEGFKISPQTVREWIEDGMPCCLIGNKWMASHAEIWAWLKKNKHTEKPVK